MMLIGIIASVGRGGKRSDVGDVQALAHHYVYNPQSTILLAVTCESTFSLST